MPHSAGFNSARPLLSWRQRTVAREHRRVRTGCTNDLGVQNWGRGDTARRGSRSAAGAGSRAGARLQTTLNRSGCSMRLKRSDVVAGSLRPNNAEDVAQHYRQNSAGVDSRAAGLEPEIEGGRVDELGIRILDVGADPASADRRRAEVVVDEGAALRPRNADV